VKKSFQAMFPEEAGMSANVKGLADVPAFLVLSVHSPSTVE
jgi:hypothetical protein